MGIFKAPTAEQLDLIGPLPAFRAKVRSQMIHVMLTVLMGWIVTQLTHRPVFLVPIMGSAWLASIFMFAAGAVPVWRIVAGVAASGVIFYLLIRFALPA